MIVPYRQGILTYGSAEPIKIKTNQIIIQNNIIALFSHGKKEYHCTLNETALIKPSINNYWIIATIDINDASLSVSTTSQNQDDVYVTELPLDAQYDSYYFNTSNSTGYVRKNGVWVEELRVKIAKIENNKIKLYPLASQSMSIGTIHIKYTFNNVAGSIVFDEDNKPIKVFDSINKYTFLTDSELNSQKNISIVDNVIQISEHIEKYNLVELTSNGELQICRKNSQNQCIAMSVSSPINTTVMLETSGYISNRNWGFSKFGIPLFVNENGFVTTQIPDPEIDTSIQEIGIVINSNTILLSIKPLIKINDM